MRIFFDKKSGDLKFQVEDEDIQSIGEIAEMTKTNGWKKLNSWISIGREAIIQAGKEGTKIRTKNDLSGLKWSKLDGYDCCSSLSEVLINSALEMVKKNEKTLEEESTYARNNDKEGN